MKKILSICLVVAIIASIFIGCTTKDSKVTTNESTEKDKVVEEKVSGKETEKPVTLKWSFWAPEPVDFLNTFNNQHKNISIEYEMISSDQYINIINTRMMSGEGPDLFAPRYIDNYEKLIKEDKLVDLTDKEYIKNFDEAALGQNIASNGKIYALPTSALYLCMFYNKEILEKNELELPSNWEEYLDACEKLKKNGIAPHIQGMKDLWQCKYVGADPLLSVMIEDQNFPDKLLTGETKFTDPRVISNYKRVEDFIKKGYLYDGSLGLTFIQAWQIFCEGKAAFMGGGTWYIAQAYPQCQPNFEIGTMPIPLNGKDQKKIVHYGAISDQIVINKEGKYVDKALEFVEWFSQPENLLLYSKSSKTMSAGKNIPSEYDENAYIFDEISGFDKIPFKKEPSVVGTEYGKVIQDLVMGSKTPEDIVKELQNKLDVSIK